LVLLKRYQKNRDMDPEENEFHIQGYDHFNNLGKLCKRGVILYTKSSLNAIPLVLQACDKFEESIWCRIHMKGDDKLDIGVIYRSPNSQFINNDHLASIIKEVNDINSSHVMIMGDFNFSEIDWKNETTPANLNNPSTRFMECLRDCYLHQHISEPTHFRGNQRPNTLDLILTNEEGMVGNINLQSPIGKSHHVVIHFSLYCYMEAPKCHKPKHIYHKGDYDAMRSEAATLDWQIPPGTGIEEAWNMFSTNITKLMNIHVPKTKPTKNGKRKAPYMTNRAIEKVKEKNRSFTTWKRSRDGRDYLSYAKARNQAKWECRKAEKDFERKMSMESKANPKAFYRYAQSKLKTRSQISNLMNDEGEVITDDKEKANIMNKFFSSVFTREDISNLPDFDRRPYKDPVCDLEITTSQVRKKIEKMDPTKSPGPDALHPRILRELKDYIAEPLQELFTLSLKMGKLPNGWKTANISPIFKKGDRLNPGNYRPVSLTSVVCKLMEQLIRDIIMEHLVSNALLTNCQHGFISGRLCITQLLATLDHWTDILDRAGNVDAIYLDFSKCFDSVPHERLLLKIKKYGIEGPLWDWIADFLRGRHQRVNINGCLSALAAVLSGIPQGSVLGPLLFIIFVNDMPEVVHSYIQMFADDTKIFTEMINEEDAIKLQSDLDNLQNWSQKWQLRFNADKCKTLHMGMSNRKITYRMTSHDGTSTDLETTDLEKDLGVWIDPTLSFSKHCEIQVGKGNRTLGLIRRTYSYLDATSVTRLYTSLVRPKLEYGYPAWAPMYQKDCELLEKVQRRATKLVPTVRDKPYEERLKTLDLPSLYYRRARGDLIEIYKHLSGYYTVTNSYIQLEPHGYTRGHNKKLSKPRTNRRVRQNFLIDRAVNSWNRLPQEVIDTPSLNSFKNQLDKHWARYRFSQRSPHAHYNYDRSHTDRPNLSTGLVA